LLSCKHRVILTEFQTKVKKKITKKAFFLGKRGHREKNLSGNQEVDIRGTGVGEIIARRLSIVRELED